jgi:hypothetical protein
LLELGSLWIVQAALRIPLESLVPLILTTPSASSVFPGRIDAERDVNGQWTIGVKVFLVSVDPVDRDIPLRGLEIQISCADLIMEIVFQGIFNVSIPFTGRVGLRPKITNIVRTAQRWGD